MKFRLVKEGKLSESTIRISTMKDVAFAGKDRLALYGKKGKVGLDRKSVSALVKAVRNILGRSFTAHEVKEGTLNEGKVVTLPHRGPVDNTVTEILGGLRSTCTYIGAKRIKDMPKCTTFVRCTQQVNQIFNSFNV